MSGKTRSSRACAAPSRTRATRARISYQELSSEESMDELYIESPEAKRLRSSSWPPKKASKTMGNKRKQSATPGALPNPSSKRFKKTSNTSTKNSAQIDEAFHSSGVIPPWHTLPYDILLQIFMYASYPVYDDTFRSTPTVKWLLDMSRLCKTFSEPALTALYRSPPLDDPYGLTGLLSTSCAARCVNYNAKIRRLDVQVSTILAYTFPRLGRFDLGSLIRQTPQLRDLALYHAADHPNYGRAGTVARAGKWTYQDSIFQALEETKIQLRSWRWNTRMVSAKQALPLLKELHKTVPFRRLQALTFVGYHAAKRRAKGDSTLTDEEHLAAALSVLPDIRQLAFEASSIVNEGLLPHLPSFLSSLKIRNCFALTSEVFHAFLVTHGTLLKELVLDHNQSLSLSFLTDLAFFSPQLEVLKMDLLYHNSHSTYRDSEPRYEDLLLPDEVPTWPSTLQVLDLVQLRNWDASTAEMFFQSLIDSAANLPCLRRLVLKAILKIGWRDRAFFRDKWIGRLQRVFLRPADPGHIHQRATGDSRAGTNGGSVEDKGASTQVDKPSETEASKFGRNVDARRVLRRQSSRTSTFSHVEITSRNDDKDSDSDVPIVPKRRSTRITKQEEDEYALPVSPDSPPTGRRRQPRAKRSNSTASSEPPGSNSSPTLATRGRSDWRVEPQKSVQGMCEVVEVRIDNLRPTEEQLNENDFLDEEASGDEDWDGDDTVIGDTAYAW
ncbi:MAG: hypothetical protein M1830_001067 [Pleopsidium flavum]|nr:MAG: hypothetical protein M1830_001067 [Pleopsidium flavum]